MQVEEQCQEESPTITHSPYYGCTVRVVSKARVCYEGILDGISTSKDRLFLRNVRLNSNLLSDQKNSLDNLTEDSPSDILNTVMIDRLTNDIHIYEQVCLNVRDIQELRLIQLPSTLHESHSKLRAIDPCLVDIRLSSSDEYETKSNSSNYDPPSCEPISHQKRDESLRSNRNSSFLSTNSNESSSSFLSGDKFADESNDESIGKQIEKFSQLTTATATKAETAATDCSSKPATLLAKKVLPKKIERHTDTSLNLAKNINNNLRQTTPINHSANDQLTRTNHSVPKKESTVDGNRRLSPMRVTITSNLNPNAAPFYTKEPKLSTIPTKSFTFYERVRFRPRLPTVTSPNLLQSLAYRMNPMDNNHRQQRQNYHYSHQRFVPPRQPILKNNLKQIDATRIKTERIGTLSPPVARFRIRPSSTSDKQVYQRHQQQHKYRMQNNLPPTGLVHRGSLPAANRSMSTTSMPERFSTSCNSPIHRSTVSIGSTISLPYQYQYGCSGDYNPMKTLLSFGEPIGWNRSQCTTSGGSSCSSLSLDTGSYSRVRLDSSPNPTISFEEQYDFEKANEEFRRYLELEELVIGRNPTDSLTRSVSDDNPTQQKQSPTHLYKREISFFDRISCTATTGTAVGYTEMDEMERNVETFGDDALLMASNFSDNQY